MCNRFIITISKHICANAALAGAGVAVRIDEPMVHRVVVTALEVIEPRLGVVVIAAPLKSKRLWL